jgi:dTDP-4-dehydrorhamnose 3,5-epimerase
MSLRSVKTRLPGVLVIEPDVFKDDRGFFLETYHHSKYTEAGIDIPFVQDNHSHSRKGTLRGLHYQLRHPQDKLVYVITGEIFDVAVDIRHGSSTFGQWAGIALSQENKRQIFLPKGFAHGFCVLSETADVMYKCSDFYTPGDDLGIYWRDPDIGIEWPVKDPVLSEKDSRNPRLKEIPEDMFPV